MNKKLLTTVSHRFEADMIKGLLASESITAYISEQDRPEKMSLYLGQSGEGVSIYVAEEQYDIAKTILDASPEEIHVEGQTPEVKFPYWIILGFIIMLIIFLIFQNL